MPSAVALLAVKVSVLELDAGLTLHELVTPLGKPEIARVTLPVNPPRGVTRTVSVAVEPPTTLISEREDERVKLPGDVVPVTVSAIVVDAEMLPELPVMVIVDVPAVAELLTDSLSTLVLAVGLVANAAITPAGKPLTESVVLPLKQTPVPTVIVSVPLLPCAIDKAGAEGESAKA